MNVGSISSRDVMAAVAMGLTALSLILFSAFIAGSGDIRAAALVIGAFIGAILLCNPVLSLWVVIVGALVATGFTQLYLPQIQFIRWPVAMFSAALGGLAILQFAFAAPAGRSPRLSGVCRWMVAFFVFSLLVGLLNFRELSTFVFGIKGYFQVFGLFLAVALFAWPDRIVDRLPGVLIGIAFLQLPFVVHQYLFLVPLRTGVGSGVVPEDVVAGTMGASATGGGANAVVSLVMLIAVAIVTTLFKRGVLKTSHFAVAVVVLVLPILLNANKVAILYLVLLYVMLFATELVRRPGRFLLGIAVGVLSVTAAVWSYTNLLTTADRATDWRTLVHTTVDTNMGDSGHGSLLLNRSTVVPYWIEEHRRAPLFHILLGHGPGAAREGTGGAVETSTLAETAYSGVGIGLTAVSALLWEVGVVGLMIFSFVLLSAWRAAGRLAHLHEEHAWRSSVFTAFRAVILLFGLSLFHKNLLVFHLPFQALLLLVLGYIAYWDTRSPHGA